MKTQLKKLSKGTVAIAVLMAIICTFLLFLLIDIVGFTGFLIIGGSLWIGKSLYSIVTIKSREP